MREWVLLGLEDTPKGATMAGIPRHQGRADPKIMGSDTSDTISDRPDEPTTDSDAEGTGVRPTVGMAKPPKPETSTDRVVNDEEAGLGGGLDQAEEARLGVTDEGLRAGKAKEKSKPFKKSRR
jgi:hypothetical protein